MTFRIETAVRGMARVFVLSGRLDNLAVAELERLFESQPDYAVVVVDLKNISGIDREVMHFFMRCETEGAKLENCPAYIREWMERERD